MPDRVADVFAQVLKLSPESLRDETSPDNTPPWDRLQAMNLVMAIEDEFGVRLSTKEIASMRSIGIVKKVLRKKGIENV